MRKLSTSNPLLHRHDINTVDQLGTAISATAFEKEIVAKVRAAGIDIDHLGQLNATNDPYPEAVDVLLQTLNDNRYPDNIRAGVAQTLQREFAYDRVFNPVIQLFSITPVDDRSPLKSALASLLIALARKQDLPEIFSLVRDRSHQDTRILLLDIMKKFPTKNGKDVLTELLDDPFPHVVVNVKRLLGLKVFKKL